MSDRSPCIDFNGEWIWTGHKDVYRDTVVPRRDAQGKIVPPELIERQASGPKVFVDGRVIMSRNWPGHPEDGTILVREGWQIMVLYPPGFEGWSAHNGLLAGWHRADRLKAITHSPRGNIAGLVDLIGLSALEVNGAEIDRGPIYEPRYTGETLVWSKVVNGQRRTYGRLRDGAPTEDLTVLAGDEFWPLAIETTSGVWVFNHGHQHAFIRPWGPRQTRGHLVRVGVTHQPDARQLPDGRVLVAFSDGATLQRAFIDLRAATVDVRQPTAPPEPTMQKPGITIDHFDSVIRPGQPFRVRWHDRNNAGFSGELEIVNGSVHVRMTNPVDTDRSGQRRPVEVRCA